MFFEILIAIFLGILFGTITGLIPGIHNNLIAGTLFSLIGYFSKIPLEIISIFILSMGLTHTFISFIPSLLLGVASSDTALSILPGQKLLKLGDARLAIFLSGIGSFIAVFSSLLLVPIFFLYLETFYNLVKDYIGFGLLAITIILILQEKGFKKNFWASLIVLFSSTLGLLTLNSYILVEPLLVLFSGLFGGAQIVSSFVLKVSKIPKQKKEIKYPKIREYIKPTILGTISASFCAIFPGIGNSQAGTLSSIFVKDLDTKNFLVILSIINTVNFMLSFVTFYILNRARNGSLIVVSSLIDISKQDLILFMTCMVFTSFIVFPIMIFLGSKAIIFIEKINIFYLNLSVLIFLLLLVFYISSIFGVLVFICASFLGCFCIFLEIRRVHLMSVLIIPIILNLIF